MEIRDFVPADQAATRALIQAGLQERWGSDYDADANPDTDDLWASYAAPGGVIVVALSEGEVVGTGTLVALTSECGQLVRMSTHRAHRRRGIARGIVEELIERAEARGLRRLVATTDTPWTSAVALYRSCGFEIDDQDESETGFVLALGRQRQQPGDTSAE